jgi:tetratricopeptide (TPR) repeat protein
LNNALPFVPRPALALTLRASLFDERGDRRGARVLLEQATAIAPQFATAQFTLGTFYDQDGDYDLAIERYQRALEAQPRAARDEVIGIFGRSDALPIRVVALNNLAYLLGVQRGRPAEALLLASRAVAEANNDPSVLDTLAWIEYLLGDSKSAANHIHAALASQLQSGVIHLHAAAIFAASGLRADAETQLKYALRLQPDLDRSGDADRIRGVLREEPAAPFQSQ